MKTTKSSPEPRCLLSVEATAARLGLAPQTIYNGISRKARTPFPIKAKRWGRKVLFDSKDVEQFIADLPYSEQSPVDTSPINRDVTPQ